MFNLNLKNSKILLYLISFAIFILLLVQTYSKAFRTEGNDLKCYIIASEDFFLGKNPYTINSIFAYIYPQFFSIIMYPFTMLPYWLSVLIWYLIGYVSFFLIIKYLLEIIQPKINDKTILIYAAFLNIAFVALMQDNFRNGQVNLFLLLLLVLFFKSFLANKTILSSIFLATAISIKLTPAIFIAFLIFGKNYRIAAFTIFLSFLFIIGLPYLFTGEKSLEYYKYYLDTFIFVRAKNFGPDQIHTGFSLSALIGQYFPQVGLLLSAIFIMSFNIYLQMKNKSNLYILFSIYLLSILLISPMSEGHHLIFALPSYIYFIVEYLKSRNKYILIILIISLLLLTYTKIDLLVTINVLGMFALLFYFYFNKSEKAVISKF